MKAKRSLSGVYFRSQNEKTNKWENVVFEDLPEFEQNEILDKYTPDQVKSLVKILANTLNKIGEELDIIQE